MSADQLRRISVVVGGGVFVLLLIGQLARVELGLALLLSLGAGVGLGLAVYLVGSFLSLARPSAEPAPASPASAPNPDETAQQPAGEVAGGADLHQTIRLDEGEVDYVLPEVSPEEVFKEREGIDEDFLKQGIEDLGATSENKVKGPGEGG